jgi:adenine-specific DNA-methyltransferase
MSQGLVGRRAALARGAAVAGPEVALAWDGKGREAAVEPRRLAHDASRGYGDSSAANMLIHGDSLIALKALEREFAGRVGCVCIDPPYNTGGAFEHYNDKLGHSDWLSMMAPRLRLLRNLLSEDGSVWISIDDDEAHYLKVLCDEVFGRENFIATVSWQKRTSPDNRLRLGGAHDFVLVYVKTYGNDKRFNQLLVSESRSGDYKNLDNDPRGAWASVDMTGQTGRATLSQYYTVTTPSGKQYAPPEGRCWALAEETFLQLAAENRIWFGKKGDARPRQKKFLSGMSGVNSWSWWPNNETGHNQEAKKENIALFGADKIFDTPKPERLIERVLTLASNPGDLVLDCFLGSGTTAAVAHKMGRRWIGIELGAHCLTHCLPRMKAVVDGERGGISKDVGWRGGGGFKFYELAPAAGFEGHGPPEVFISIEMVLQLFEGPAGTPPRELWLSPGVRALARKPLILREWIPAERMSSREKEANPSWEADGGYLARRSMEQAWAEKWDGLPDGDKRLIQETPGFDAERFFEITGIETRL